MNRHSGLIEAMRDAIHYTTGHHLTDSDADECFNRFFKGAWDMGFNIVHRPLKSAESRKPVRAKRPAQHTIPGSETSTQIFSQDVCSYCQKGPFMSCKDESCKSIMSGRIAFKGKKLLVS